MRIQSWWARIDPAARSCGCTTRPSASTGRKTASTSTPARLIGWPRRSRKSSRCQSSRRTGWLTGRWNRGSDTRWRSALQAAPHETPGRQDHGARRDHLLDVPHRPGVQPEAPARVRLRADDPALEAEGHPETLQAPLEGLLEAQPRDPRRHGGDFEHRHPQASFEIAQDLRRAGNPEHGRQPHDGGRPEPRPQLGCERLAAGGHFERAGQALGEDLARPGAPRQAQARRAHPGPALAEGGRDLARAEALQSLDVGDETGGAPAECDDPVPRRGRHAVGRLQGADRGDGLHVPVGLPDIGQPLLREERDQPVERRPDPLGRDARVRVPRLGRRERRQAGPGVVPDLARFQARARPAGPESRWRR